MAKILSIITALFAGLALYFGLESKNRVVELQAAGKKMKESLVSCERVLKTTQDTLAETEKTLAATKDELDTTKGKLRDTEADLNKTKTDLAARDAELQSAKADLAKINDELAKAGLAGDITSGIGGLTTKIADLTKAKADAEAKVAELEKNKAELETAVAQLTQDKKADETTIAQKSKVIKRYTDNIMEKGVRGRVMAVNTGWGFAVLSIGDRQGAAANRTLIVARGGQAIGRVRITNVEATQSVADIIPGTFVKGMYVQPGDDVIYTGDDKVKGEEGGTPVTAPVAAPQPELPAH